MFIIFFFLTQIMNPFIISIIKYKKIKKLNIKWKKKKKKNKI